MYEYIKSLYGMVFTAADLPAFMAVGWITAEQAVELQTPTITANILTQTQANNIRTEVKLHE